MATTPPITAPVTAATDLSGLTVGDPKDFETSGLTFDKTPVLEDTPVSALDAASKPDTSSLTFDPTPVPRDVTVGEINPDGTIRDTGNPLASIPEVQVAQQGIQGLKESGQDVWSAVKSAATHPLDTLAPQVGGAVNAIRETIPVLHAYETARSQGKSIMDSLSAANEQAKQQNTAVQALKDRMTEFKTNPTVAQVRLVGDAAAAALAVWAGGELAPKGIAPEVTAAPETALPEEAAEPGLIQKITKGKEVAQEPAQTALRTGTQSVAPVQPESLRTVLEEPIDRIEGEAKSNYRQIDKAAGTDFKALNEKLSNTEFQIRQLTDTAEDSARETDLMKSRQGLIDKINAAKAQAVENGVDPTLLDKADSQFKQAQALRDVEQKVFKNPNIVRGNSAMGTPETINVDSAVKTLQSLQDSRKYGAPRLEQALGRQNANQLLKDLYAAQRTGASAAKIQARIILALKVAGGGAGLEVLRKVAQ